MPIGNKTVLIGMSERSSRQAISQLAAALFEKHAAERVVVAAMPKLRAAMHLDTVFTFADRDCVLLYPDIVNNITAYSYRPADNVSGLELRRRGEAVRRRRGRVPQSRSAPGRGDRWQRLPT